MKSPLVVTDTLSADHALRLIRQGSQLLWEGDFQNAKQLLTALDRRLKAPPARTFQQHRRHQSRRARILNSLLIAMDTQYAVPLRRAPDLRTACLEAYGPAAGPRAIACASDNLRRLELTDRVTVQQTDLFPDGRADLIVCNPPWIPARPISLLDHAVYDENSQLLQGFLAGLTEHLRPNGEAWLILSDLAEHLNLRTRAELLALFHRAGLVVAGKTDIRPTHSRSTGGAGFLQRARGREITSLWRLRGRTVQVSR